MGSHVSAYCFYDLIDLEATEESASRRQLTVSWSALTDVYTCEWPSHTMLPQITMLAKVSDLRGLLRLLDPYVHIQVGGWQV